MSDWFDGRLADSIAALDAGVSVNAEDRPHGAGEIGVLKTSAVCGGQFLAHENKTVIERECRLAAESVQGDSILVSRMNTPALVGESCYVHEAHPSLFLPDRLWQLKPQDRKKVSMRWLSFVLQSANYRRYVEIHATGTSGSMKNLPKSKLLELPVSYPEPLEQTTIAQVLDTLDTAIHETEAIIAKLKAVKQGLLHDLLTRGIEANGELRPPQAEAPHLYKPSPLGGIPKEWTVDTLRNAALPSRDSFIDGDWIEAPFITSEGIRLVQTGNIGVGEFLDKIDSRRFISQVSFRMLNCKWVKAGDILICRLADPIGRACVVPEYVGLAITSVDCTIFRVDNQSFSREFVLAWVNADASLKRARDNAAGSTRSRISRSNLGMLPIAKPPLHEQQLIASALQSSAKRVADEEAELSKLRETKAGLMDDLLTGRIRVTPLLAEAAQQPGRA